MQLLPRALLNRWFSTAQAMRDLGNISSSSDLELAVAAAQLVGHESAKVPDHDAIIDLQTRIEVSWWLRPLGVTGTASSCTCNDVAYVASVAVGGFTTKGKGGQT